MPKTTRTTTGIVTGWGCEAIPAPTEQFMAHVPGPPYVDVLFDGGTVRFLEWQGHLPRPGSDVVVTVEFDDLVGG